MKIFLFFMLLSLSFSTLASLKVSDVWIKAVPPMMKMSAAYMTIENTQKQPVTIVGAESKVCDDVEIHTHSNIKGVMKMRQLKSLEIEGKSKVILKPKGLHLMFIQLTKKLNPGMMVPITLKLSSGESIHLNGVVKKMQ